MSATQEPATGFFERTEEHTYRPTAHASGAWDPGEQHFSPLGGLIVHAIDRYRAGQNDDGMLLGRISFDILGRLAMDDCEIQVATIRPGRTIELIEATVSIAHRPVVRARAWYLASTETRAVAGGEPERLPSPDALASQSMTSVWPGGYIASLDVRPVVPPQPGRGTAWISTDVTLVAGEAAGPVASFVALVDTANGIAVRQPPTEWMFPNLDLTIHLFRQPAGRWTGLDTTVAFGPTGQGITSTVLHDVTGSVGHAQQILTVRPLTG
ncbi:MAG: thioesterase family protein [Mycetocola sp.]